MHFPGSIKGEKSKKNFKSNFCTKKLSHFHACSRAHGPHSRPGEIERYVWMLILSTSYVRKVTEPERRRKNNAINSGHLRLPRSPSTTPQGQRTHLAWTNCQRRICLNIIIYHMLSDKCIVTWQSDTLITQLTHCHNLTYLKSGNCIFINKYVWALIGICTDL
jgi:hypothetical protein